MTPPARRRTTARRGSTPVQWMNPPVPASRSASGRHVLPSRRSRRPGLSAGGCGGAQLAPEADVVSGTRRLRKRCFERREGGLRLVAEGHEAALEARDGGLVAVQEVDQQVDPRVAIRDVRSFREIPRLQRRRDAEQTVGRVALIAVLAQPDACARKVACDEADQLVDRRHRDRRALLQPPVSGVSRLGSSG